MDFLLYILAGAAVGFAIGVTGVGGGSLMTPLLLLFGYPAPVAIGTDLLYAAITKAGGAISHHRQGQVRWRIVLLLAAGSIPASLLVNYFLINSDFRDSSAFETLLTRSLGTMLIITSIILIYRNTLRKRALENRPAPVMNVINSHRRVVTVIMGAILGVCVTLSSVGAGAFGAALLLIIYANMPAIRIIGTDIAHAVPLTLIAGLGYLGGGYVDFTLLFALLVGSLPAITLGSRVGSYLPEKLLQWILILLLMGLGLNYAIAGSGH